MLILPIEPGVPFQTFQITLANNLFNLAFRWNERLGVWSMDVLTPQDTLIAAGLKLLGGAAIGSSVAYNTNFPAGNFIIFDTTGNNTDPDLDSLGRTIELIFVGLAEMDLSGFPSRIVETPLNGPDIITPVIKKVVEPNVTGVIPDETFEVDEDTQDVRVINPFGYAFLS